MNTAQHWYTHSVQLSTKLASYIWRGFVWLIVTLAMAIVSGLWMVFFYVRVIRAIIVCLARAGWGTLLSSLNIAPRT